MKKNKWKLGIATVAMGVALLFGGMDYASAATSEAGNEENGAEVYLVIKTAAEFKEFAANAKAYSGKLVQLGNDIKFDETVNNYSPIYGFNGTFDGCGYTISGIDVTDNSYYTGLFGSVERGGIVKNVIVENCDFDGSPYSTGGIVGICYDGQIINCHVRKTTISGGAAGGISGNGGRITNCSSNATVTGSSDTGGIAGYGSYVKNCYNFGKIETTSIYSTDVAGGIVGEASGTVQNCYSTGSVTGKYVGGIVGKSKGIVANCYCPDDYMIVAQQNTVKNNAHYSLTEMQSAKFLDLLNSNIGDNKEFFRWEIREGSSYPQHVELTEIDNYTLTLSNETYTYDGKPCTPTVTVSGGNRVLEQDTDYEVIYSNNVNAGTASVTVRGNGMYIGELRKTFTISKADSVITYTDAYQKEENAYQFSLNAKLTTGKGSLTYTSDNSNVAEVDQYGYVTVRGIGVANITISVPGDDNYNAASVISTVTVTPRPKKQISDCTITLLNWAYKYNGQPYSPAVSVKNGSNIMTEDEDYTLTYSNNIEAGVATVVVSGKGEYGGEKVLNYNIDKANSVISGTKAYNKIYGSGAFKLDAKLTEGESGLSYTSANPAVATVDAAGKVTMKGVGVTTITISVPDSTNYTAKSENVTITVRPKSLKLKLSVSGKRLKMKWKRDKKVTGYEVQYALDPYFSNDCKIKEIKKNKKTTYIGKGMKKKTKYYARIRSYKNVNVNGRMQVIYSDWSKVVNKSRK